MAPSKFKHIYAEPARPDGCFLDTRCSSAIWDCSNFLAANSKFFAMAWLGTGGGKVAVFLHSQPGRLPASPPGLVGHTAPVIDWAFHPFNEYILATASEDTTLRIWSLPEDGLQENVEAAAQVLEGHGRKVGILRFHPSADNVLASAAMDHAVRLWDLEKGISRATLSCHKDQIFSLDWNLDGGLLCSTSKDKLLRVLDPRSGEVAAQAPAHLGTKPQKALWAKSVNRIVTLGFGKQLDRQVLLWDPRKLELPIHQHDLDTQSGVMMAVMDEDNGLLFVGGKGDGNLRVFDVSEAAGPLTLLTEASLGTPQRGLCFLPKAALDTRKAEVMRMLKLENNQVVPVSFICPRKQAAHEFQADIYPPTFASTPALTAEAYFCGQRAAPKLMSLNPLAPGELLPPPPTAAQAAPPPVPSPAPALAPASAAPSAAPPAPTTPSPPPPPPVAPAAPAPPVAPPTLPAPSLPAAASAKPAPPADAGRVECVDGKKWEVSGQRGTRAEGKVVVLAGGQLSREQSVYLYNCHFTLVKVEGKVNSVQVVDCQRVDVAFQDVIAAVEVTNSKGVQLQAAGALPSVFLEKAHDVMLFLSQPAMDAAVTTCACTGINVTLPPRTPGGDPVEVALPEQYITTVVDRRLETKPTEHKA